MIDSGIGHRSPLLVHPVLQALLAGCFTWMLTALGAAAVFLGAGVRRRTLDIMLGFTSGVMIAASYWSLLAPAIAMSQGRGFPVMHNIPEGLAIGVAFGAAAAGLPAATLSGAITLALGIGLQNFPEGLAVAAPLRREGLSRFRSFWYGQLSAVVAPIAAVPAPPPFLFPKRSCPMPWHLLPGP